MTDRRFEQTLQKQKEEWPNVMQWAKRGNPLATLCLHCYGRHQPPRDEICPNEPPKK